MVRLDDLTVFVNGSGAYHGQVTVRQFGFQHISGARIPLPAIQQYMDFINKQDSVVDAAKFFQDIFQAVFNFSFIGRSGYE